MIPVLFSNLAEVGKVSPELSLPVALSSKYCFDITASNQAAAANYTTDTTHSVDSSLHIVRQCCTHRTAAYTAE